MKLKHKSLLAGVISAAIVLPAATQISFANGNIEESMEHRNAIKQRSTSIWSGKIHSHRICKAKILHDYSYQRKERPEDYEHPDDTEYVEQRMGTGSSLSRSVTYSCSHICRDGRSDVLTKHHCTGKREVDESRCGEEHGDGHGRTRRLQHHGKDGPCKKQYDL